MSSVSYVTSPAPGSPSGDASARDLSSSAQRVPDRSTSSPYDIAANPAITLLGGMLGGVFIGTAIGLVTAGPAGAVLGAVGGSSAGIVIGFSVGAVLRVARQLVRDVRRGTLMENSFATPGNAMFTGISAAIVPMTAVVLSQVANPSLSLLANAASVSPGSLWAGSIVCAVTSVMAGAPSGLAAYGVGKTALGVASLVKHLPGLKLFGFSQGLEHGPELSAPARGCVVHSAAKAAVQTSPALASALPGQTRGAQAVDRSAELVRSGGEASPTLSTPAVRPPPGASGPVPSL